MRTLSHFGIPTTVKPAEAAYIEPLKVYVTDYGKSANKLEFLYFEPDSPMHELMKTRAHVAYDVPCLKCEPGGCEGFARAPRLRRHDHRLCRGGGHRHRTYRAPLITGRCVCRCGRTVSFTVRPLRFAVVCRLRDV
ncbi:MAG: hypothetical protein L6V80_04965 [Bacteroidales bacterium]|nr:MAG: hypothetical protein L6V80_04965 [Bacteroidales bacterium]